MRDARATGAAIRFVNVLNGVSFRDWSFVVRRLDRQAERFYLQAQFDAPCALTGKVERQRGRKWLLSQHMTDSEIVQTALMATLAAVEHEAREDFHFDGAAVFGPHMDVRALHGVRTEVRA